MNRIILANIVGYWMNNAKTIRLCELCFVIPAWIIYNIIVGAYTGILNEVIVAASIIISIIRFGWSNMDGNVID